MDAQVFLPPPPPPPPPPFFAQISSVPSTSIPPPPPPPAPPVPTTTTTINTITTVSVPSTETRVWLHPWTTAEMRENASQWSLAGDAGLLLYLEQFSDRLVQRADTIQQHLNQTVTAVKSTHTRVQNCLNEFISLSNTQFIENRVYDEDETASGTPPKKEEQPSDKGNMSNAEAQEKVLQRYAEAIQYGLAILDSHFERVDPKLENGAEQYVVDDDDNDAEVPIEPILEPKDPYIFRPLPLLIGTPEFMQDNYVGLGDLLNIPDEDVEEEGHMESDRHSTLVSTDDEDDEDDEGDGDDENEYTIEVSSVPIVPAGASRPVPNNTSTLPRTATVLTDSEDDEDDPFGTNKTPLFNDFSFKEPPVSEKLPAPTTTRNQDFGEDSDNDQGDYLLGIPMPKPAPTVATNDNFDKDSDASEDNEQPKNRGGVSMLGTGEKEMSALEKAVEARRKKMENSYATGDAEKESEPSSRKPTNTSNDTLSQLVMKLPAKSSANTPSSSTIAELTKQPLTGPEKSSKPSIFGGQTIADDDDDNDDEGIFNSGPLPSKPIPSVATSSSSSTTVITTTIKSIVPPRKEKDIFGNDTDEEDDPFAIPKKPPSIPVLNKTIDSNAKTSSSVTIKPKPIESSDDDDEFITPKKPAAKIPVVTKPRSASSEDELFQPTLTSSKTLAKPQSSQPPVINKPPVAPSPTVLPAIKNITTTQEDSDEDDMFGLPKKQSKVIPQVKSDPQPIPPITASKKTIPETPEEDDGIFGGGSKRAAKLPTVLPTKKLEKAPAPVESDDESDMFGIKKASNATSKVSPTKKSDDEDTIFVTKPTELLLPPPVVLPPLPSRPKQPLGGLDDPLSVINKPVETQSKSPLPVSGASPVQPRKDSMSSSDDELRTRRPQNTAALKDGEKPNVGRLAAMLGIPVGAHKPGGLRPKAPVVTEDAEKAISDDEPTNASKEPVSRATPAKQIPKIESDSDDDDLFRTTKKAQTPVARKVEAKEPVQEDEKPNKVNTKTLSSQLIGNLPMRLPGASPKPSSNNEHEPSQSEKPISFEASKDEPVADKTMSDMLKDKIKVSVPTRTPRSRPSRSAAAPQAAAASSAEPDDLFGTSSSTKETPPLPPPPAVVVPAPIVSAPAPSTGLPSAAPLAAKTANAKEKKKFSLFDSDDSDIDQLLFGSDRKKKSSPAAKPTTTASKSAAKASMLELGDDDDDFLAKRPVRKSNKPIDGNDIFADVTIKGQQTNKAKKDWSIMGKPTDDIFNDTSASSKSKAATSAKTKPNKDIDDIFDDPLNVISKR